MEVKELLEKLKNGVLDNSIGEIYAPDGGAERLNNAKKRIEYVLNRFSEYFGSDRKIHLFSSPGRTELGGNHTDHQNGRVLCASVNLDMLACAAKNNIGKIRIKSENNQSAEVDLSSLEKCEGERETSASLVRGIAAKITELGFKLTGLDVYMISDVLPGSGLSSSAAFEVLIGTIINSLCCDAALDEVKIAQIGQFAENTYFGKPCGLMDQMACAVGGALAIDFENPELPKLDRVEYDFLHSEHVLCIVDTRSGHADLSGEYAAITKEMKAAAQCFGKEVLREVEAKKFEENIRLVREKCGDRAVLRAMHFFAENERVLQQVKALEEGAFESFLKFSNESGMSSMTMLQNIWQPSQPESQAVTLALTIGRTVLKNEGAVRVHGGGFGGTVQAFVPVNRLQNFVLAMENVLGKGCCHMLEIRKKGSCEIK